MKTISHLKKFPLAYFPVLSALLHCLTYCHFDACYAADGSSAASTSARKTFVFPNKVIGHVMLVPRDVNEPGYRNDEIGLAVGTKTFTLPANKYIVLECNGRVVDHPELLEQLSNLGLEGITFTFASMEEGESRADIILSHLSKYKTLKVLNLDRSDASDAGLSALKNNTLESISVFLTETTGSCFKNLQNFPKLSRLDVGNCPLKEENIKLLPTFPHLTHLSIRSTRLSPGTLQTVCNCSGLMYLDIMGNKKIDDRCLRDLLKLRKLEELDIRGTSISLKGLKQLKGLPLKRVEIQLPRYNNQDLTELHACFPNLKLHLASVGVDHDNQIIFAPIR